jgi:hypothetical protein
MAMLFQSTYSYSANNNQDKIKKTFDSFRYKMTVVNDINNPQFKEKAAEEFKSQMSKLQSEGVSASEILSYTRASILDASNRKDFDLMFSSIDANKISSEDAGNMAMRFMASKYQQGANYSGSGKASFKIALISVSIVIVGVVTYLVIKDMKGKNTNTATNSTSATETATATNSETNTYTETYTNTYTNTNTNTGGCCPCGPPPVYDEIYTAPAPGGCCQCSQDNIL